MKPFPARPSEASLNAAPANAPLVGRLVMVRGVQCRITVIRPAGTVDCESVCGKYAFRISGLNLNS